MKIQWFGCVFSNLKHRDRFYIRCGVNRTYFIIDMNTKSTFVRYKIQNSLMQGIFVFVFLFLHLFSANAVPVENFINFEVAPQHSMDMSQDGKLLAVCNTPDGRVEFFDLSDALPLASMSIPVGLDPVSVHFRNPNEVWVVNKSSDTVSVIDLNYRSVKFTLDTLDEPNDLLFAGSPERVFISCATQSTILVYNPNDLSLAPVKLKVEGNSPRNMAVSADGTKVYVAIFESGNRSTYLGGGLMGG